MKTYREPPPVLCKHCQIRTTRMTGTGMCDRCWELDRRIRNEPEVAEKILNEVKKEKLG